MDQKKAAVISIALQKGGTGKSTTALNLAGILGSQGNKVLLIDLDDQGNSTYASNVDPEYSITNVLTSDVKIEDAICHSKYYDLLAADEWLANVERDENFYSDTLKKYIDHIIDKYDYIIIDTPPALGNLSINALAASKYVIVPCDPRPFALQGLGRLNDTLQEVKTINPELEVLGVLLVKYSERSNLNKAVKGMVEDFTKEMGTTLFKTMIREGVAVPESQIMREPLVDYAPKSNPLKDYEAFTEEVKERIG